MQHVEIAEKLLRWNTKNLVAQAALKKSEIGNFFAEIFQVKANGRNYDANYDNYFEFLNQFRSTIRSIDYDLQDFIVDKTNVVIPLTAHIIRVDGRAEDFEAILILQFNKNNKIVLWHEVYVSLGGI
jgi:hypothetical protein